jgi:hypothetical protein
MTGDESCPLRLRAVTTTLSVGEQRECSSETLFA